MLVAIPKSIGMSFSPRYMYPTVSNIASNFQVLVTPTLAGVLNSQLDNASRGMNGSFVHVAIASPKAVRRNKSDQT